MLNKYKILLVVFVILAFLATTMWNFSNSLNYQIIVESGERNDVKSPKLELILSIVPGDLFGEYITEEIYVIEEINSSFKIKMRYFEHLVSGYVDSFRADDLRHIDVSPPDIKYGRVATFVVSKDRKYSYLTGFKSKKHGDVLLVYFDKPGRIVGDIKYYENKYKYNIIINEPGLVWLTHIELKNGYFLIEVLENPSDIYVSIKPTEYKLSGP